MKTSQPTLDITIPQPPIPHPTQPGNLPQWIADQLHQDSRASHRTLTFHHCRHCNAIVATGLDADTMAFTATIDPTPISPASEIACIILARHTYTAWPNSPSWELTYRDPHLPLDTRPHRLILPAHQCGRRFPGFITPAAPEVNQHTAPPF